MVRILVVRGHNFFAVFGLVGSLFAAHIPHWNYYIMICRKLDLRGSYGCVLINVQAMFKKMKRE